MVKSWYPYADRLASSPAPARANNLANINAIVAKYRGANVVHLWAQLAIKRLDMTRPFRGFFRDVHRSGSVSKPCTPGEPQNSW